MLEVTFLLAANLDAQRAYDAFENFQEGRGDYFSERLEVALELLKSFPEIGPAYEENFRRLLVKDVNYAIFYTIEGQRILIQRVLELRQDPVMIRRQLRGDY